MKRIFLLSFAGGLYMTTTKECTVAINFLCHLWRAEVWINPPVFCSLKKLKYFNKKNYDKYLCEIPYLLIMRSPPFCFCKIVHKVKSWEQICSKVNLALKSTGTMGKGSNLTHTKVQHLLFLFLDILLCILLTRGWGGEGGGDGGKEGGREVGGDGGGVILGVIWVVGLGDGGKDGVNGGDDGINDGADGNSISSSNFASALFFTMKYCRAVRAEMIHARTQHPTPRHIGIVLAAWGAGHVRYLVGRKHA